MTTQDVSIDVASRARVRTRRNSSRRTSGFARVERARAVERRRRRRRARRTIEEESSPKARFASETRFREGRKANATTVGVGFRGRLNGFGMATRGDRDDARATGSLQVIFGPMFSGKSTELQRRLRRHVVANRRVLVVKYAGDNRYDEDVRSASRAVTHDLATMPAVPTKELHNIDNVAHNYDVIGIDEGQFFDDIAVYCEKWAQAGKTVIVAALDGTFQRKPFKSVLALVPLAEEITKLTAVCTDCAANAAFTARTSKETAVELIGGTSSYKAVCRACYGKYAPQLHHNGASTNVAPKSAVATPLVKRMAEQMHELSLKTPAAKEKSFSFATPEPSTPQLGGAMHQNPKNVVDTAAKTAKKSRGFGGPGRSPLNDFLNSSSIHRSPLSTLR